MKNKLIAKLEELIHHQKKFIYQLDRQPNSIGREWRERVEGIEKEVVLLISEIAALKAEMGKGDGKIK